MGMMEWDMVDRNPRKGAAASETSAHVIGVGYVRIAVIRNCPAARAAKKLGFLVSDTIQ